MFSAKDEDAGVILRKGMNSDNRQLCVEHVRWLLNELNGFGNEYEDVSRLTDQELFKQAGIKIIEHEDEFENHGQWTRDLSVYNTGKNASFYDMDELPEDVVMMDFDIATENYDDLLDFCDGKFLVWNAEMPMPNVGDMVELPEYYDERREVVSYFTEYHLVGIEVADEDGIDGKKQYFPHEIESIVRGVDK